MYLHSTGLIAITVTTAASIVAFSTPRATSASVVGNGNDIGIGTGIPAITTSYTYVSSANVEQVRVGYVPLFPVSQDMIRYSGSSSMV
jgi:hypothetical protein